MLTGNKPRMSCVVGSACQVSQAAVGQTGRSVLSKRALFLLKQSGTANRRWKGIALKPFFIA